MRVKKALWLLPYGTRGIRTLYEKESEEEYRRWWRHERGVLLFRLCQFIRLTFEHRRGLSTSAREHEGGMTAWVRLTLRVVSGYGRPRRSIGEASDSLAKVEGEDLEGTEMRLGDRKNNPQLKSF